MSPINDGANSKAYIDGSDSLLDFSLVNITTATALSFYIGNNNYTVDRFMDSPTGLFKVHKNKALTATEVTAAYTKAKAIYTSLP